MTHWHIDPGTGKPVQVLGQVDAEGCCRETAEYLREFKPRWVVNDG